MGTATRRDTSVLVQLADGNYLPLPAGIARGDSGIVFLGLDAVGDAVVHLVGYGPSAIDPGPEVVNRRAYPAPFLDGADYADGIACAECHVIRDDLAECDGCSRRTCACDHDCEAVPPAWPSDL